MLRPAKRYSPTAPLRHSTKPGENKLGPSLAGVFGRKSGTEPGHNYSSALKAQNVTWDEASLEARPRMPPCHADSSAPRSRSRSNAGVAWRPA